jgi:hypothetical protein
MLIIRNFFNFGFIYVFDSLLSLDIISIRKEFLLYFLSKYFYKRCKQIFKKLLNKIKIVFTTIF